MNKNTFGRVKVLVTHSLERHQHLQNGVVYCFLYFGSNIRFQRPKMIFTLTPLFWTEFFVLTQNHSTSTINHWTILNYFRVTSKVHKFTTHRYRSSRPEVFLRKGVLKICSKFTGEHPCRSAISINLQLYQNHILEWVLCCKFAAYFQKTFS